MYTMVLMMAASSASETPDFGILRRGAGCAGSARVVVAPACPTPAPVVATGCGGGGGGFLGLRGRLFGNGRGGCNGVVAAPVYAAPVANYCPTPCASGCATPAYSTGCATPACGTGCGVSHGGCGYGHGSSYCGSGCGTGYVGGCGYGYGTPTWGGAIAPGLDGCVPSTGIVMPGTGGIPMTPMPMVPMPEMPPKKDEAPKKSGTEL